MMAVAVVSLAGGLAAQAETNSPIPIPLPEGAFRRPDLEQAAGPINGGSVVIYHWEAPMEMMVNYYLQHFGGERDRDLNEAATRPGYTTSISYHLFFYTFADQCADSAATTPDANSAPCKHWLRAKDLSQVLHRRADWSPGLWVQRLVFTWYQRDLKGPLTRWTATVFDSGLSPDWKSYMPTTELIIKSELVKNEQPAGAP